MASVRKHRARWKAIWSVQGADGKRRQQARSFDRKADARAFAARMEVEIERRGVEAAEHTVATFIDYYLSVAGPLRALSETTIPTYRRNLDRLLPHIGKVPLGRLSGAHLDRAYASLLSEGGRRQWKRGTVLSPTSVAATHKALSAALAQAVKWKWIPFNPCRDASPPRAVKTEVATFSADEVRLLLRRATADKNDLVCILSLLFVAGLRRGELIGIAEDAIDFETGRLTIRRNVIEVGHRPIVRMPKGKKARSLVLPTSVLDLLSARLARVKERALQWGPGYQREPLYLFPAPDGSPGSPDALSTRLRTFLGRAGVSTRKPVHNWRHACASQMLDQGVSLATVAKRLGHSSVRVTADTYIHEVDARDGEAAEKLEAILAGPGSVNRSGA